MRVFDKLREVRAAMAAAEDVPPYRMGSNRLLREIARTRPTDRQAMLGLNGKGEKMWEWAPMRPLRPLRLSAAPRLSHAAHRCATRRRL